MEINAIISSVIPVIMERQKQNNQVMLAFHIPGELGKWKLLQNCTGIDWSVFQNIQNSNFVTKVLRIIKVKNVNN